jgi:hypothetical protein
MAINGVPKGNGAGLSGNSGVSDINPFPWILKNHFFGLLMEMSNAYIKSVIGLFQKYERVFFEFENVGRLVVLVSDNNPVSVFFPERIEPGRENVRHSDVQVHLC